MKTWWPALLIVLPGGSFITLGVWLRRRWLARDAASIDAAIRANAVGLADRRAGQVHDESLQAKADVRRAAADEKRRQAASIASGKPAPLIRRVS